MKKISMNDLDSLGIEKLSRENLKAIQGGASQCWMEDGVLNCCPDGLLYNAAIALCDLPENVGGTYSCSCALKNSQGVEVIFDINLTSPSEESCSTACANNCTAANNIGGDCTSSRSVFGSVS